MNWPKVSINTDISESLCFGCGQKNPVGLKLRFKWDGKTARAELKPGKLYQGWPGIIHGGILTCLLDEAMTYAARFKGFNCITARMQIRFKRPALVNDFLVISSSIIKNARKLVETRAWISLQDGTVVAEGKATQYVVDESQGNIALEPQVNA
jgi:acyl-coenzyme A thioesterase PaaI-like protein